MDSSLRLFVLVGKEETYPEMVAAHSYKDAVLYFLKAIKHEIFSRFNIECYISTFFFSEYKGDDKPILKYNGGRSVVASIRKLMRYNPFRTMDREDRCTLFLWILNKWDMKPCCIDDDFILEGAEDSDEDFDIYSDDHFDEDFYSSFSEEFFKLPEEKQFKLGNLFIDWIGFHILSKPIAEAIGGLDQLTKPYEEKCNQMRLDTLKVMRRNVPGELFDAYIPEYLNS